MSHDPKPRSRGGITARDIKDREVMTSLHIMRGQYAAKPAAYRAQVAVEALMAGGASYKRHFVEGPSGPLLRITVSRDAEEKVHQAVLVLSDNDIETSMTISPYHRTVDYDFDIGGEHGQG